MLHTSSTAFSSAVLVSRELVAIVETWWEVNNNWKLLHELKYFLITSIRDFVSRIHVRKALSMICYAIYDGLRGKGEASPLTCCSMCFTINIISITFRNIAFNRETYAPDRQIAVERLAAGKNSNNFQSAMLQIYKFLVFARFRKTVLWELNGSIMGFTPES